MSTVVDQLAAGGRPSCPFDLELVLEPGDVPLALSCEAVLRHLPGRRLVARVRWQGANAVLKLFLGAEAERYRSRELAGLERLEGSGARVPARLALVRAATARGFLSEHLDGSSSVAARDDVAVAEVVRLVACLHSAGSWQTDPHLDNFLVRDGLVYAIDGDGVRGGGRALGATRSIANLGLLLAQFPPAMDDRLPALAHGYLRERGWSATPGLHERIDRALGSERLARMRRYLRKSQRACTEFDVRADAACWYARLRGPEDPLTDRLFADPDALVSGAQVLKAGNSATVVRLVAPGDERGKPRAGRVLKRYNVKSFAHAVRRALEPMARFRRAWCFGQLLALLEIPTARPLALVERGAVFLRFRAWLLLEDLGDLDLATEVARCGLSEPRCAELVELFLALRRAHLRHGDTKASNFLVHEGRLHLIDLDAMRIDRNGSTDDVLRFLENWEGEVRVRLETAFRKAGLI